MAQLSTGRRAAAVLDFGRTFPLSRRLTMNRVRLLNSVASGHATTRTLTSSVPTLVRTTVPILMSACFMSLSPLVRQSTEEVKIVRELLLHVPDVVRESAANGYRGVHLTRLKICAIAWGRQRNGSRAATNNRDHGRRPCQPN